MSVNRENVDAKLHALFDRREDVARNREYMRERVGSGAAFYGGGSALGLAKIRGAITDHRLVAYFAVPTNRPAYVGAALSADGIIPMPAVRDVREQVEASRRVTPQRIRDEQVAKATVAAEVLRVVARDFEAYRGPIAKALGKTSEEIRSALSEPDAVDSSEVLQILSVRLDSRSAPYANTDAYTEFQNEFMRSLSLTRAADQLGATIGGKEGIEAG